MLLSTARPSPRPSASQPADSGRRRADIQGLRAVAVIFVVLYHAGAGLSGGFVGVDVFFVISGFVITGMLGREIDRSGHVSLRSFYLRRGRRLLPALAVVSLATSIGSAFLLSPLTGVQETAGAAGAAASVFVANGYFLTDGYFNPVAAGNPFLHLWSLSVEEQFYLGFPLLLWLGRRLRRPAPALAVVLIVSFGFGLCFTLGKLPRVPMLAPFLHNPQLAANVGFFTPMARAWEFLAGALLALLVARRRPSPGLATLAGAAGAVLLCLAALRLSGADSFPGWHALVPVLGTLLLLAAGSGDTQARPNILPRLLSTRPMVRLGDVSYSWYLWHWPMIVLARAAFPGVSGAGAIAALLSLAPAITAYRLVERPIHLGQRFTSSRGSVALAIGCLLLPLASGYGLKTAAHEGWGQARIADIQAVLRPEHLDELAGCTGSAPLGSVQRSSCRWTVPHASGTVLLIGDSNAGQLTEPFIAAARANGLDAEVATAGGCPFVVFRRYFSASCREFVENDLRSIVTRRPAYAAVVISNASVAYVSGYLAPMLARDEPGGGSIQDRATAGWSSGIDQTLRRVSAHSPVVLIGAIPKHMGFPGCLAPTILAGVQPGCGTMSAEAAGRQRDGVVEGDRRAVAEVSGRYLDTAGRLCGPTTGCSTTYHHVLAYRDGSHLSVAGSYIFQDDLRAALASLLETRTHPARRIGSVRNR